MKTLHELFVDASVRHGERTAVIDPAREGSIRYGELDRLSDRIATRLEREGVTKGARVGIISSKSIGSVAAILGVLKAGAAYVPVDPTAPLGRGAGILADCEVRTILVEERRAEDLSRALKKDSRRQALSVEEDLKEYGVPLDMLTLDSLGTNAVAPEGLAYILYTSGSTGKPKGVMHTHTSARCFVDWCSETFDPDPRDRFSSHAPFHFDLSILDLYVSLANGSTVVLFGEEDGKNPLRLAPLVAETGITIWYSTPSVLRLLLERGELADQAYPRLVLFAGEVFAPTHLRRLQKAWSGSRYFNLYGPTETNVCTWYEVTEEVPADRIDPYPIGKPISGDDVVILDEKGGLVPPGQEGELLVSGGTVMAGYWNRPELDTRVFRVDSKGRRWYRTGDVVRENEEGDYVFLGRRDRMVKRRGYRVELGEIESILYHHPKIQEAAVVSDQASDGESRIRAFVSWNGSESPSTIAMKRFCAENLPLYMVPDRFVFLDELPKTSTDKLDYVRMTGLDA